MRGAARSGQPAPVNVAGAPASVQRVPDGIVRPCRRRLPEAGGLRRRRRSRRLRQERDPSSPARAWPPQPKRCDGAPFEVTEANGAATHRDIEATARVDLVTGRVAFLDAAGAPVLEESGRTIMPAVVLGENTQHVRQEWAPAEGEALYGLGENQLGLLNLKGYDLDLWQHNGTIVIPFLVSSRGWGDPVGQHLVHAVRRSARARRRSRPSSCSTPTASAAASPAPYYSGADFKHLVGERVDRVIDIALSSKEKKPNQLIYAGLPEGERQRALDGRGRARASPATTRSRPSPTAASSSGSTIGWSSTTGARGGCRGKRWPACASRPGTAHKIRLEWSKDQNMETVQLLWKPPAQQDLATRADLALVGGRRRHRLLLRLRPRAGPRRRRLPARHRAGADAPALGAGALAEPAALRNLEAEPRRRRRFPQARHPLRQHRAGLVLLEGERLGLARVRSGALPRSGQVDPRRPRPARAPDDLGVGQVLSRHQELRGDAHARLPLPPQPRRGAARLGRRRRLPVHLLRRVQSRGGQALLVADERDAVQQARRRLVAGRARAGPPADARRSTGSART